MPLPPQSWVQLWHVLQGLGHLSLFTRDVCGEADTKDVMLVLVNPSVVESGSRVDDDYHSVYGDGASEKSDGCGSGGGHLEPFGGVWSRS